jgi:Protein of unknown function (DUF3048) N-terminal domain/Protein of unknown function (DUF3048) C-terminal domain
VRRHTAALAASAIVAVAVAGCSSSSPSSSAAPTSSQVLPLPSPTPPPPIYPLTGLPVTDPATLHRPAVSVKIDNVAGAFPQAGLQQADIVTEELVEGGLTRLFATFQSTNASLIGPIRSIRPVDAYLAAELGHSIIAFSGGAQGEIQPSIDYSGALLESDDALGAPTFYRVTWRYAPHNVFSSTSLLYGYASAHGHGLTEPPQLFSYGPMNAVAKPVKSVTLPFSGVSTSTWTYSGLHHAWFRTQDGAIDQNVDGSQVSTTNVVILSVTATPIAAITDAAGNHDMFITLIGSGRAWVLRNGHIIAGTWTRTSLTSTVKLTTASGAPINLEPGRSWLELQPTPYTPQLG